MYVDGETGRGSEGDDSRSGEGDGWALQPASSAWAPRGPRRSEKELLRPGSSLPTGEAGRVAGAEASSTGKQAISAGGGDGNRVVGPPSSAQLGEDIGGVGFRAPRPHGALPGSAG